MTNRRRVVLVADPRSEFDDPVLIEYPMRPLTKQEYERAREDVQFARDRIRENGGKCGREDIDENVGYDGEWSNALLRKTSRKWSYTEACQLADALEKCEITRTTEALCKLNGISEKELRQRYNDWCNGTKISNLNGIAVQPDFAIPHPYETWVVLNADDATLKRLHTLRFGLVCRQVWRASPKSADCACAAAIARSLVDQKVISGAQKHRYGLAYEAVVRSFAGTEFANYCPTRCPISFSAELS